MRKLSVIFLAALAGATTLSAVKIQAQDFDNIQITVNKVTDSIYYLEGSGGNIGLSVGDDGVFIIDDQFAPLTEKIKAAISQYSDEPVQFVFNTHFHYDHTDGNENFGAAGAILVAQENARLRMSEDNYLEIVNFAQQAYDVEGLPKITFQDSISFHYNGHTINAFHLGPAHTDGDAIVQFVEANVLHTGDVFVRYGLPYIDVANGGNLNGMIRLMWALIEIADENTKIIPGHGQLSSRQDMIDYTEMLETIRDRVYQGIQDGMTLDEITASEPIRGYPADGLIDHEAFTKIAYDSFFQ